MNDIQVFNNEQFGDVRRIVDTDGNMYIMGKDVCNAVGDKNPQRTLGRIDEQDKRNFEITDSMGRKQTAVFVNESGFYALLFAMQPQKAHKDGVSDEYPIETQERIDKIRRFKHWVTSEVLVSIRKHGMYATPVTIDAIIANPDFGIKLLTELKTEQKKNAELQAKVETDKPKVLLAESITASNQTILIGQLAKILNQNGMKDIGQNRLYARLRKEGYLGTYGNNRNIPTQRAIDMGLFRIKKSTYIDKEGRNNIATTVKVTGKGIQYFVNKYLGENNHKALEGDLSK